MKGAPDFAEFFRALWGRDPFPWQILLAERVATGRWPRALDLPTAAGKTACVDIAVYALAVQADRPIAERTAPRRIWFVVDRRIVVDEAFERARTIAERLGRAAGGPLKGVADRLRSLSGTGRPLAVGRLRGGILRDDGWARIPSQPAVITSTVDQLGSRILFRGYQHGLLSAPIFAGLAANDSLIILDEAHCAVPFMQTLAAVQRYRGPQWAEDALPSAFASVVMSATPPQGLAADEIFPGGQRATALDHPELHRRLRTSKRTELVAVDRGRADGDALVLEATRRAEAFLTHGSRRVAVMVNRVDTARSIAASLSEATGGEADIVLLTGRIRPLERDDLVEEWTQYLRASEPEELPRPVVVVATQCLEVGADFSFDALITECASLDALRQRFGRLARLGSDSPARAAILARASDIDPGQPDFVYGEALAATWKWLVEQATDDPQGRPVVDMGVEALESRLRGIEDLSSVLAPSPEAPVLLPSHLDLLCQTAPIPHPSPDISLYLHGRPGPAEVSVVWRCDLAVADAALWVETIGLCPPVGGEMLQVPLWRVRAWLSRVRVSGEGPDIEGLDVEGSAVDASVQEGQVWPCLVWRGRDRSRVVRKANDIGPGDVVVVPASYGLEELGQAARTRGVGDEGLDLWEAARLASGQAPALRLTHAALRPWLDVPPLKELLVAATSPAWEPTEVRSMIQAVLDYRKEEEGAPPPPPDWWLNLLVKVQGGRMIEHPAGGLVLVARQTRRGAEPDLFVDDDDLASAADREVALEEHSQLVRRTAERLAQRCLPEGLHSAVALAALWHDAGKLDPRFQVMLRRGDEVAAAEAANPIAKSAGVPTSPALRRAIRDASGLPEGFRHEMLSMQLAHRFAPLPENEGLAELLLHLIASHHGHGRPFAPVVDDASPPGMSGELAGVQMALDADVRATSAPAHRLDSGVLERFWRLTRRYGWWGLAYLEAIVRLADWYASNFALAEAGEE